MKNPKTIIGVGLLTFIVILAVIGPTIAKGLTGSENPLSIGGYRPYQLPTAENLIGTDGDGRDGMAVFLSSIGPSLRIGVIAGVIATAIGVTLGFTAGYLGGKIDIFLRIIIDMVLVFPILPDRKSVV